SEPDGEAFSAYADALRPAWARRLKEMGDRAPHATSTTNFCVLDREGNVVVVTQTLLSLFGARLLLPETGVLMNNGINWFDPRPASTSPAPTASSRTATSPRRCSRRSARATRRSSPTAPATPTTSPSRAPYAYATERGRAPSSRGSRSRRPWRREARLECHSD